MNQENILSAAKNAKSAEELKQIAVDNGITLTDEKVNFYFSMLDEKEGDLSLDDLAAVTGGGGTEGSSQHYNSNCLNWRCQSCGSGVSPGQNYCRGVHKVTSPQVCCQSCVHFIPFKIISPSSCNHYSDNGYHGGGGCG